MNISPSQKKNYIEDNFDRKFSKFIDRQWSDLRDDKSFVEVRFCCDTVLDLPGI